MNSKYAFKYREKLIVNDIVHFALYNKKLASAKFTHANIQS